MFGGSNRSADIELLAREESSQPSKENKQPKPSKWDSLDLDSWFWEALAIVFSILCFIAILCLLGVYDQRASPDFPHGLRLNTIISVLATATKSSLLCAVAASISQLKWIWFQEGPKPLHDLQPIDNASRGPMGCLAVLKNPKGRLLISLGAIVTLLALAFDPFIQQILSYPVREVPSDLVRASAPQAIYPYTPSINRDTNFTSAVNAGIWASSRLNYSPTCPLGNCTWDSFQSAGWCSKCADVTGDAELDGCTDVDVDPGSSKSQLTTCHVKLPHGSQSKTSIEVRPNHEISHLYQYKMYIPNDIIWAVRGDEMLEESIANDKHEYLGVRNPLLAFAHAELDFNVLLEEGTALPKPEKYLYVKKATECVISMCSRTYDVSVTGGVPSMNVSSTSYGETFLHPVEYGKYQGLDDITSNMTCWRGKTDADMNLEAITFNNTVGNTWSFGLAFKDPDQFAFCPLDQIRSSFVDALEGRTNYTFYGGNMTTDSWQGWGPKNEQNGTYTLSRILDTGLEPILYNIATSLTKYNIEESEHTVKGTTYVSEVYVAVDWTFISLPAAVLGLSVFFWISAVLTNKRAKLNLWKSSSMALLYHGLDYHLVSDDEHATVSGMETTAKMTKVQLALSDTKQRLMLQQ